MMKQVLRNRTSTATTVEQLKRYGYSAAIIFAVLAMSTVLLFGSPTFELSPATILFDFIVYPVLILLSLWLIRGILRGQIPIRRFEKPMVIFFAFFYVSKYGFTLLTAPTVLSLAYVESWYWMMIGVWTFSFLTYSFRPAMLINLTTYLAELSVTVTNVLLRSDPTELFDRLSNLAASNFRLSAALASLVILGYIKHQWVSVEKEAMLLRSIANKDPLTGLPNRRWLNDALQTAVENPEGSLTVIMFDLDGFKEVNDRFGHAVGDEVLRQVGQLAQDLTGPTNTVGRWGGEEFLIICPNTDLSEGARLADELRHSFASHNMIHGEPITGSFGVAELLHDETAEHLITRSDRALYAAKDQGKNLVYTSGSDDRLS